MIVECRVLPFDAIARIQQILFNERKDERVQEVGNGAERNVMIQTNVAQEEEKGLSAAPGEQPFVCAL
jgi:hypothetical protein